MDELARTIILALLQGLTEFLPISSSAHLILPSRLLGWPDQGLAFDVAVHVGSLLAVMIYFRRDLLDLLRGSWAALGSRRLNPEMQMLFLLGVATIPVGLAGVLLDERVSGQLRSIAVIATTTVVFGLLLGLADWRGGRDRSLDMRAAIAIGLAQALAVIPGTSRSGITMTAALFCGLDRQSAARFSFLLSIPVILAAGVFKGRDWLVAPERVDWSLLSLSVLISALTAYATIALFLRLLDRLGFLPFVIYRCALGSVLFFIWL